MSPARPHLVHSLVRSLVLTTAAVLGLLGTAAPAQADTTAPQLSISVDDGQTGARSGTTLRYTLTVTNLGGTRVRDLAVSQTIPSAAEVEAADDGGTTSKGAVRWRVDVPAGKSVTLRTSVAVRKDLPPELFRLASVACAATSSKAAPTVCASDSDELPAGAAATEQQRQVETAPTGARPGWWLPTGVAVGGLVAVGALLVTRTRRTRRDGPGSAESSSLASRGTGPEDVASAQPSAGELLQR